MLGSSSANLSGHHARCEKSLHPAGGAVDTHGARDQWMCVFVYEVGNASEPATDRLPMSFTEVYLGQVRVEDFRKNARERGS
jgi:hypothetical protein